MDKGKEFAKIVSDFVNGWNSNEINDFIAAMNNDHKTLQQSFTRLCVKWFFNLAEKENYDSRNEASIELAKKLKPILENSSLPFI